jgi:hypothetical protein
MDQLCRLLHHMQLLMGNSGLLLAHRTVHQSRISDVLKYHLVEEQSWVRRALCNKKAF